jgi:hypothetical protein
MTLFVMICGDLVMMLGEVCAVGGLNEYLQKYGLGPIPQPQIAQALEELGAMYTRRTATKSGGSSASGGGDGSGGGGNGSGVGSDSCVSDSGSDTANGVHDRHKDIIYIIYNRQMI